MGGTLLCLVSLLSRDWIHHERLVFPLVRLPLEILGGSAGQSFFRHPATWIGVAAAVLVNAIDILRTVVLGVGTGGGIRLSVGAQIKKYPWAAAFPMTAFVRPGLIGLGYLVSTELAFSIWFFYLFHKLQALIAAGSGYRLSGMPFAQEQGIGAYVIVGLILLWKGRTAFRQAWRGWWSQDDAANSTQDNQRWLLVALVVGIGGMLVFMIAAGMQPWLAALYLGILLLVALTYARIRAEAGIPLVWAYPYGQQYQSIWNFAGAARLTNSGASLASPTIFALLQVLARGYFPSVSGYEIEGINLGERTGARWGDIAWSLLLGIGFGAVAGIIFHLRPYYARGAAGLRGGIWGWQNARQEFTRVLQAGTTPEPNRMPKIVATSFGGLFVLALSLNGRPRGLVHLPSASYRLPGSLQLRLAGVGAVPAGVAAEDSDTALWGRWADLGPVSCCVGWPLPALGSVVWVRWHLTCLEDDPTALRVASKRFSPHLQALAQPSATRVLR